MKRRGNYKAYKPFASFKKIYFAIIANNVL